MHIVRPALLLLLTNVAVILAVPARDEIVAEIAMQKRATTTTKANLASSIVSALCTNPGSNFNSAILSAASEFCTRFLNIKTSTVQVTSGTTATVTGTATGPSITISTVRTSVTVIVTPPPTTVTIPSTFTEPGSTETVTAPRSTITVVKTNTITTGTRKTIYTRTVTQTSYVAKRADGAPSILANQGDSVISTVCKCLAKTPTVTRTSIVATTKTIQSTPASITTSVVTITDTVTTELDEFTRSIFTTVTLPGEDETITVTSPATTITKTATTILTTTDTIKTVTTKTTKVKSSSR